MVHRFPFTFSLLILALLSACVPVTPTVSAPPPPAATMPLPTPAPTAHPATAGGQFEVTNTSPDMPEVLVESMAMVFEYQLERAGPWKTLAAACKFAPAAPILVQETKLVQYDCQLQRALPPGAELRTTVEIRLFGSDQVFQLRVRK